MDDEDYMKLAESKKGLSRYILDGSLPMEEILVAHDDKKCNRTALWTLCTDVMLDPNVITSVAFQRTVYELNIMKDLREDGMQCFLPANLQMNFTTELLKLVYAKSGSTYGEPNINEFQLEFPSIFPQQKRSDSGLWVCSWIAVDSKHLFSKFG
ncbi:hypothetical protein LINPERHAP2_LOCUS23477, partial [Linum perenne]